MAAIKDGGRLLNFTWSILWGSDVKAIHRILVLKKKMLIGSEITHYFVIDSCSLSLTVLAQKW